MKKLFLLSVLIVIVTATSAQEIARQSIEDSVIGWMKVYHFKGVKVPMTVDFKTYSAAQLSIRDSLANWIQASYLPKGGIGDVKKAVSPKINEYSPYAAALPKGYGATAYANASYNAQGKLEHISEPM